ncbi:DUF2752 domain-containing protein [Enterococcus casseliflavus]|uniref:DUF2752 domain-containing protein n=1 Tax=Enterococcus TaxID=1350 RepID=UPI0020CE7F84|nr:MULTISPECIES: DUF2752 domain-containing protein [Enterococcus]
MICPFKWLTGFPCPGCGMTRAYLHLFQGDLEGALHFHPLFWLVPIVFGIVLFKNNPKISKLYHSHNLWLTLTLLVLVVYGGRLWLHFPHDAPMDFDPESIFPQLLRRIGQVIH